MLNYDDLKSHGKNIEDKLIEIRRTIHENPELGVECQETADYIEKILKNLGLEINSGLATSGIEAMLWGKEEEPVIAIRADMDALPIQEDTGLNFSSSNDGKMHACGHDGHVAIVLGAAMILSEYRDQLPGSIKFIFQPGEEYPGAAEIMIEEGVLKDPSVDALISGHIYPGIQNRKIGIRLGPLTARNDEFDITLIGDGGHGAHPDKTQDPLVASAILILELQTIISRMIDPVDSLAINIGEISGGGGHNVVPKKINLKGTIRSIEEEARDRAINQMEKFISDLAASYDLEEEMELVEGEPVLRCDKELMKLCKEGFEKVLNSKKIVDITKPSLGSDDCAYYSEKVPVVYFRFGSYDEEKGYVHDLHTSKFDFNENILSFNAGNVAYAASLLLDHFKER